MKKAKTTKCPECGCKEFWLNCDFGEEYRMCKSCRQEWWIDIDYTKKE